MTTQGGSPTPLNHERLRPLREARNSPRIRYPRIQHSGRTAIGARGMSRTVSEGQKRVKLRPVPRRSLSDVNRWAYERRDGSITEQPLGEQIEHRILPIFGKARRQVNCHLALEAERPGIVCFRLHLAVGHIPRLVKAIGRNLPPQSLVLLTILRAQRRSESPGAKLLS